MHEPPNSQNARGAEGPGAEIWQLSEHPSSTPGHTSNQEVSLVSKEVSPDVEIILDWWADWRTRTARYQLAAEVIGLSDEKREELEHEGDAIGRIMLAIGPERVSP